MAKRKRKKPQPESKPRDPYAVLMYILAGVLGVVMLSIIALVWFEKLPEQHRATALGGITGLAGAATTAAGIAANRGNLASANAKQTQTLDGKLEEVTQRQTDELKDHTTGAVRMVKNAYDEWAKYKAGNGGNQSAPVTFTPDSESEANKRARAEWRQQQPSPPPT